MEQIAPTVLVTDLIDKSEFDYLEDRFEFFRTTPVDSVNSAHVMYKSACLRFFMEKFPHMRELFKFPNEPMIFATDYRSKTNSVNVGLSVCYLESLLLDSNIVLSK